jgi:hypothetical protein
VLGAEEQLLGLDHLLNDSHDAVPHLVAHPREAEQPARGGGDGVRLHPEGIAHDALDGQGDFLGSDQVETT